MKLILLEGIDGVGKTTAAKLLQWELLKINRSCEIMREPDGAFRQLINENNAPATNLMLFLASRAELCKRLESSDKEFVILDRFSPSTLAYQSRYFEMNLLVDLDKLARNGIVPDLTFYWHLPFAEVKKRFEQREQLQMDKAEEEKLRATDKKYEEAFKLLNWRFEIVRTIEYQKTGQVLLERLKRNGLIV